MSSVTRLEPGIKGLAFAKECGQSDKPLRRALGMIVASSINDFKRVEGNQRMIVAGFKDITHVQDALQGQRDIDLGIQLVPKEILQEVSSSNLEETVFVSVLLLDSGISLTAQFWIDKDVFCRA